MNKKEKCDMCDEGKFLITQSKGTLMWCNRCKGVGYVFINEQGQFFEDEEKYEERISLTVTDALDRVL